jgi:hypothetical protein
MNNSLQTTSAQQMAVLEAAAKFDAEHDGLTGTTNYVAEALNLVQAEGVPRETTLAAQSPVVAMALEQFPSSALPKALAAAKAEHDKCRGYYAQIKKSLATAVDAEYRRLVAEASALAEKGHPEALDNLESEADLQTRYQSERDAFYHAIKMAGHAQIPHAVVIAREIDTALGKLSKKHEADDAERCKKFGIPAAWSSETKLIHSVRVQHARRTFDLRKMATLHRGALCSPVVRITFDEFLFEVAAWPE